jgi:glycerophosphoryl diester phosphodiesterase
MHLPPVIEQFYHRQAQSIVAPYGRRQPPHSDLRRCRIIAHRGEHDNLKTLENTYRAFDLAMAGGIWGIELDVRWTADDHPVIFHDPDCRRLFGRPERIDALPLGQLTRRFPAIAVLEEVVRRYGRRLHLMIEIKPIAAHAAARCALILMHRLRGLRPVADYHLMSLKPEMFKDYHQLPSDALLPIAELNVHRLSRLALKNDYAGLAGHFLLLTPKRIARHQNCGQKIGTGFVDTWPCLCREVGRGVDWLFSNRAVELQARLVQTVTAAGA